MVIETVISRAETFGWSFDVPERGLVYAAIRLRPEEDTEAMMHSMLGRLQEHVPSGEPIVTTADFTSTDAYSAVVRWIVWRAMRPAGVGLTLGPAAAYLGTRIMKNFLYGISPTDAISLGTACLLLLAIGAVASWLPARRAASVDPLIALRAD